MQYASSAWDDLSLLFHCKKEQTDHFDMHGISVHFTVNCYCLDAQLLCCPYHPTSNFPAAALVNNASKGVAGGFVTGWQSRFYQIKVSSSAK